MGSTLHSRRYSWPFFIFLWMSVATVKLHWYEKLFFHHMHADLRATSNKLISRTGIAKKKTHAGRGYHLMDDTYASLQTAAYLCVISPFKHSGGFGYI